MNDPFFWLAIGLFSSASFLVGYSFREIRRDVRKVRLILRSRWIEKRGRAVKPAEEKEPAEVVTITEKSPDGW